jgi:disulfide bond formation protein DsbB
MAFDVSADKGPAYVSGALALCLAAASILIALGFEHIGGYASCPLCLMQRYAYYAAIPALFGALVLHAGGHNVAAGILFLLVGLAFLANAVLGVYHAGAEWQFWPGPDSCAGGQGITTSAGTLLSDLQNVRVVRCDEASWRFLGLSFAGWNVVTSITIMALSLRAAFAEGLRPDSD